LEMPGGVAINPQEDDAETVPLPNFSHIQGDRGVPGRRFVFLRRRRERGSASPGKNFPRRKLAGFLRKLNV
jgi:hypothetical protein